MITFSKVESDRVGEPSAIDPNSTLEGASIPQPQGRDVDLEVFFLGVVGEGDSALVVRSHVPCGHHGDTPGARLPAPVFPVVSVHGSGRVEAFHRGRAAQHAVHLPGPEHGAGDCGGERAGCQCHMCHMCHVSPGSGVAPGLCSIRCP